MARTVKDYIDIVKQVRDNIPNETEKIVNTNEKFIINLNTKDQLYSKGENAKGKKLMPEYAPFTVQIKQLIGQPYDRVTLFYSGNFYKEFVVSFNKANMTVSLWSEDDKTIPLMTKYGIDIFGLNKDNQQILNEKIIKPALWNYLKRYL